MKKLLALMLCLMMALSVAGCGDDNKEKADSKPESAQSQLDDKSDEESVSGKEEGKEEGKGNLETHQTNDVVDITSEELNEIVEQFNNTDDPEVKEQLRQRLEEIFAQAEAASIGVIPD